MQINKENTYNWFVNLLVRNKIITKKQSIDTLFMQKAINVIFDNLIYQNGKLTYADKEGVYYE